MLHNAVIASKPYESILVNDFSPGDARRRHEFMKQIVVPVKCIKFTYSGSKEHLVFIWKVDNSDSESFILSKNMEISSRLRKNTSDEKRVLKHVWKTDTWKNRVPQGSTQTIHW